MSGAHVSMNKIVPFSILLCHDIFAMIHHAYFNQLYLKLLFIQCYSTIFVQTSLVTGGAVGSECKGNVHCESSCCYWPTSKAPFGACIPLAKPEVCGEDGLPTSVQGMYSILKTEPTIARKEQAHDRRFQSMIPYLPPQLVTTASQGTTVTGAYVYSCNTCESRCCCGTTCCDTQICVTVGQAASSAIVGTICTGCTSLCCCGNQCCAPQNCGLNVGSMNAPPRPSVTSVSQPQPIAQQPPERPTVPDITSILQAYGLLAPRAGQQNQPQTYPTTINPTAVANGQYLGGPNPTRSYPGNGVYVDPAALNHAISLLNGYPGYRQAIPPAVYPSAPAVAPPVIHYGNTGFYNYPPTMGGYYNGQGYGWNYGAAQYPNYTPAQHNYAGVPTQRSQDQQYKNNARPFTYRRITRQINSTDIIHDNNSTVTGL